MLTYFKRSFHFALTDFYRNQGISLVAVFILSVVTLLFTGLFLLQGMSGFLVKTIQNKIDITAYFRETVAQQDILQAREDILKNVPGIDQVIYVSQEEALSRFKEKYQDNTTVIQALKEVGENPFLPSLNITTKDDPAVYENVSHWLQNDTFDAMIDRVDFSEKRDTIQKVFSITRKIQSIGLLMGLLFIIIALLVVFNTIKMVINNSKEEISTMSIVGASDWFIKTPFILEGALFGGVALGISFILTILLVYLLSGSIAIIMPGFSLIAYTISSLWLVIFIQILSSIGLGTLFSFIAVKKYLQ